MPENEMKIVKMHFKLQRIDLNQTFNPSDSFKVVYLTKLVF